MKHRIPPTAGAVFALVLAASAGAHAQDYPVFERDGYPLTPLQLQVLEPDHVEESPPISSLARDGMPASPHQLSVLRSTNGTTAP